MTYPVISRSASTSSRPRLVLHLGAPKTGSTSIQKQIQETFGKRDADVYSPSFSHTPAHDLALLSFDADRWNLFTAYEAENAGLRHSSPIQWQRHIDTLRIDFLKEITHSAARTLVMSSELLWFTLSEREIANLSSMLHSHFDEIVPFIYLRNPLDYAVSFWITRIGVGEFSSDLSLGEYGARFQSYVEALRIWSKEFAGKLNVLVYEDEVRRYGGVVESFFAHLHNIVDDTSVPPFVQEIRSNPSLSWQQARVLNLLNRYYPALDESGWVNRNRGGLRDEVRAATGGRDAYVPTIAELRSFAKGILSDAAELWERYGVSSTSWLRTLSSRPTRTSSVAYTREDRQVAELVLRGRGVHPDHSHEYTLIEQLAPFERAFPID